MTDPESIARGTVRFRLGDVLGARAREEGGWAALARAITKANRGGRAIRRADEGDVIDRRRLANLVRGEESASLTPYDFFALDRYLEAFGEGLASRPILRKPDLMEALAASGRVKFLVGAKPDAERTTEGHVERRMVSHYDLLGMGEIQRSIGQSELGVRSEVELIPLHNDFAVTREAVRAYEALLLDEYGPSLVCLGSARSNPFAELMLCAILGYPCFEESELPERAQPPFQLIWNRSLPHRCPSHFHASPDSIRARDGGAAELVANEQASVLVTPDRICVDQLTPRGWGHTFGVIVAQRRRRGQVWLLLLGITGASTFLSAKLANRLATQINEVPQGQNSDIFWGIVEARVDEAQKHELLDLRQFALEEIKTQQTLPQPVPPPAD